MGLIGWALLGGKFRCIGWSGVTERGRGPLRRLKRRRKPSLGDRGTPTHLRAAGWRPCAHLPGAARGLGNHPAEAPRGPRALILRGAGGGTDCGLAWMTLGQICARSSLERRSETTLRFWARVLFVCFFGFWLLVFSHLKTILWCALDNREGAVKVRDARESCGCAQGA